MCAQTRPRFILSSERVLGGMEFEPMLTPREKSLLPENVPRGGLNPRRCGQRAQALGGSEDGGRGGGGGGNGLRGGGTGRFYTETDGEKQEWRQTDGWIDRNKRQTKRWVHAEVGGAASVYPAYLGGRGGGGGGGGRGAAVLEEVGQDAFTQRQTDKERQI